MEKTPTPLITYLRTTGKPGMYQIYLSATMAEVSLFVCLNGRQIVVHMQEHGDVASFSLGFGQKIPLRYWKSNAKFENEVYTTFMGQRAAI